MTLGKEGKDEWKKDKIRSDTEGRGSEAIDSTIFE